MDEKILEMFLQNPDEFISGEELSEKLSCSRTAIWKHIQSLRKKGYEFEAQRKKGYRLIAQPAFLEASAIRTCLKTNRLGSSITIFKQVDSTQNKLHEIAEENDSQEGTLVIAEQQETGRGRMGRPWHSPPGKGIWMSFLLKPQVPLQQVSQLTLLIAVAVARAIRQLTSLEVGIKWPNDLLVNGKKICGILLESSAEDERLKYVIAGIGISANIKKEDFPEELRSKATSLFIESGKEIHREQLICQVLQEIEGLYDLYQEQGFGPIQTLWEALNVTFGKKIKVETPRGKIEGMAEGLNEMGALVLRLDNGKKYSLFSGEIEFGII
jgi:BirA family biotin operon repressor/biotin-[acetyl-CoA-carboxylase] ligase